MIGRPTTSKPSPLRPSILAPKSYARSGPYARYAPGPVVQALLDPDSAFNRQHDYSFNPRSMRSSTDSRRARTPPPSHKNSAAPRSAANSAPRGPAPARSMSSPRPPYHGAGGGGFGGSNPSFALQKVRVQHEQELKTMQTKYEEKLDEQKKRFEEYLRIADNEYAELQEQAEADSIREERTRSGLEAALREELTAKEAECKHLRIELKNVKETVRNSGAGATALCGGRSLV